MEWLHDYFFAGKDMEGAAVLEIDHQKFSLEWRSRKVDGGLSAESLEPWCPVCPADTKHLGSSSVPPGTPDGWRWLSSPDSGRSRETQGWCCKRSPGLGGRTFLIHHFLGLWPCVNMQAVWWELVKFKTNNRKQAKPFVPIWSEEPVFQTLSRETDRWLRSREKSW